MFYALLDESEQVIEVRDYAEPLPIEDIKKLSNGLPCLRPLIGSDPTPYLWETVEGPAYTVEPTQVLRDWFYADRPLADVQRDRFVDLEELFNVKRAEGFMFEAEQYPLTTHAQQRNDVIRRQVPVETRVLTVPGRLAVITPDQIDPWLMAADQALGDLYIAHDNHVAGIMAAATPEAAGIYDITTGWPV